MGTYLLNDGATRRLLGTNALGQPVVITRLCDRSDLPAAKLRALAAKPPRSALKLLASLVEIGLSGRSVYAVELAPLGLLLQALHDRAMEIDRPMPHAACATIALALLEAATELKRLPGAPSLRVALDAILLGEGGSVTLLGGVYASLLPLSSEEEPWLNEGPGDEEVRSVACLLRQLATLEGKHPLEPGLEALIQRALIGQGFTAQEFAKGLLRIAGAGGLVDLTDFVAALGVTTLDEGKRSLTIAPWGGDPGEDALLAGPVALSEGMSFDGQIARKEAAAPALSSGRPRAPAEEAPLEIDEERLTTARSRISVQGAGEERQFLDRPKNKARWIRPELLGGAMLIGIAGGGYFLYLQSSDKAAQANLKAVQEDVSRALGGAIDKHVPVAQKPMLLINTEPAGAEVYSGQELLGRTPYAGDNDLPPGENRVRLVLRGHVPSEAKFQGGTEVNLTVHLHRQK